MNVKQKRFSELVAQGRPKGRAYEEAGYESRGHNADTAGERLSRNVEVSAYIQQMVDEAKAEAKEASRFTTELKLKMLYDIAKESKSDDPRTTIAAIAEENRMTGGHAAEKVAFTGLDAFFGSLKPKGGLHNDA